MKRIERTAYHEAGHVAACFVLRRRLCAVSIIPDEDTWGRVVRGLLFRHWADIDEPDNRQRKAIQDHVVISYAGPAAEKHASGRQNTAGAMGDHACAIDLGKHYGHGSEKELNLWLDWLAERAANLVRTHWYFVEPVARELLVRGQPSLKAVREILLTAARQPYGSDLLAGVKIERVRRNGHA